MDWDETVKDFLDTYRRSTARQYRRFLEEFAEWYRGTYGEDPQPELLTSEEAREWRAFLTGVRKHAASTVNARLSALKGVARYAGGRLEVQGIKTVPKPVQALTARELGRLVRAVDQHDWGPEWFHLRNVAVVALMARAGLRVSEVVTLNLDDVELNDRSGWVTVRQGKGLKERRVPLSLQARRALAAYLEARPKAKISALFLNKDLDRLQRRPIQRMIKSAAQRAGIEQDVSPHTLRHTFATRFLEQGGDLATLRDIMGHANVTTTLLLLTN